MAAESRFRLQLLHERRLGVVNSADRPLASLEIRRGMNVGYLFNLIVLALESHGISQDESEISISKSQIERILNELPKDELQEPSALG